MPVLQIHIPLPRSTLNVQPAPVRPYGCHNREPFQAYQHVQDGWVQGPICEHKPTLVPVLRTIEFRGSRECRYVPPRGQDPRCAGCRWSIQA